MDEKTSLIGRILTVFGIVMTFAVIGHLTRSLRGVTWQMLPKTNFILGLICGISLIIAGIILRIKAKNK
jgi:NADH:ubiquinone oxidoreductase subunit 2 (subunit N)